jgi:hypothetical protein
MKYCGILKQVIKKAKNQCYFRLIAKFSSKVKMTWTIIRNETGQLYANEQIRCLLVYNEKLKDPKIVTNAFNKCLIVAEKFNIKEMPSYI